MELLLQQIINGLVLGSIVPLLASQAVKLLPFAAFLLVLGSFLTAALDQDAGATKPTTIVLTLVWAGLGVPLITAGGLHLTDAGSELRAGILVSVLAPPVSGRTNAESRSAWKSVVCVTPDIRSG